MDTFTDKSDAEGNLQFRYVDADSSKTINAGDTDITEFTWDHRDRLAEVADYSTFSLYDAETPDSVVDYIYDCFNHRVGSLYDTDGDDDVDLKERYVWQGKNVALDFIDTDGAGVTESLELANRYLWGQMVDQLLAQETVDDGGVEDVLYPVRDNLGSTRSLVNYLGQITATYSYDSFGNVTVQAGYITDTRYLYTCQEYDLTTGFYYYDARWYDPAVGKFILLDPVSFIAGDANLYRYCGNSALVFADPSGECARGSCEIEIDGDPMVTGASLQVYNLAGSKIGKGVIDFGTGTVFKVAANAFLNFLNKQVAISNLGKMLTASFFGIDIAVGRAMEKAEIILDYSVNVKERTCDAVYNTSWECDCDGNWVIQHKTETKWSEWGPWTKKTIFVSIVAAEIDFKENYAGGLDPYDKVGLEQELTRLGKVLVEHVKDSAWMERELLKGIKADTECVIK